MPTTGWSPGFTQANLVVVPKEWAFDMLLFGQRNPKPVPLLDVTEPGAVVHGARSGADLRTDLPRYRVWRDGGLVDEPTDVVDLWADDLVSLPDRLQLQLRDRAPRCRGAGPQHRAAAQRVDVPDRTWTCRPAGRLSGPLVVSMRPVPAAQVVTAVQVTARMPDVHGAPVHVASPESLGIPDLARRTSATPSSPRTGDVPVFWACGVTPQAALMASKPPFAITHAPGLHVRHRRARRGLPPALTRRSVSSCVPKCRLLRAEV